MEESKDKVIIRSKVRFPIQSEDAAQGCRITRLSSRNQAAGVIQDLVSLLILLFLPFLFNFLYSSRLLDYLLGVEEKPLQSLFNSAESKHQALY